MLPEHWLHRRTLLQISNVTITQRHGAYLQGRSVHVQGAFDVRWRMAEAHVVTAGEQHAALEALLLKEALQLERSLPFRISEDSRDAGTESNALDQRINRVLLGEHVEAVSEALPSGPQLGDDVLVDHFLDRCLGSRQSDDFAPERE